MAHKLLIILTVFYISAGSLFSQSHGDSLFNTKVLHEIRIEFDEDNFWEILMNNYNAGAPLKSAIIPPRTRDKKAMLEYFSQLEALMDDSKIEYLNGYATIDGNQVNNIGVRLKGYSSFFSINGYKKSIKLDFDAFNDTLKYDGMRKVNLNNGVGDPSFQRDFISYHLLRKAGVMVPRVSYAKVFLNGIYWGLYAITEQVDEQFLEKNFASGKGNLFKTVGWNELAYTGNNFKTYAESIELKTNEETADGSDYIRLVKSLNQLNGKQFADSIQKLLYVDYYFKVLAIDILSKNWDSYIEHGRNFYLYHEPVSDLFYWIPWDYNLAWDGTFNWNETPTQNCNQYFELNFETTDTALNYSIKIDKRELMYLSLDFGDGNIINWDTFAGNDTIFTAKGNHFYNQKAIYNTYIYGYYANGCMKYKSNKAVFMDTTHITCPTALTMNRTYFENDTVFKKVYKKDNTCCECQWDLFCENFYNNFAFNADTSIDDSRYAIDFYTQKTLISKLLENDEFKNRYLDIFKYILDSVYIVDELTQLVNSNTNLIRDAVYADTNFIFTTTEFENEVAALCNQQIDITSLNRFIKGRKAGLLKEYASLNHTAKPLEKALSENDIVINEFVANASPLNNNGADWIELYNNTKNIVPLNQVWLSDDVNNPMKFNIPKNAVIKPDGFVVIWADNENKKNGLHANFKLSDKGEDIVLYHHIYNTLDQITYPSQIEDSSFARYPNGTGSFIRMKPTRNSHNVFLHDVNVNDNMIAHNILMYPNPATSTLNISSLNKSGKMLISVYNLLGSQLINEQALGSTIIDVSSMPNGIYAIHIEDGTKTYKSKFIVLH